MWDWSSFGSGVLGALFGGGVSVYVALLQRSESKRERRAAAVEELCDEAVKLLEAHNAHPIANGNLDAELVIAYTRAMNKAAKFNALVARRDGWMRIWTTQQISMILDGNTLDRTHDVMELSLTLSKYLSEDLRGQKARSVVSTQVELMGMRDASKELRTRFMSDAAGDGTAHDTP